ncbi:MAG TPA: lysylphosphatidylglycerol synthase domain-containing protein, partial [Gemmatimonadaceae bacterium]|nr:lysylphosphatidylglycerol synthase domain-containing protein [Gemmatimonadaceae bacterium]
MNHKVARGLRWALTAVIVVFLIIFARTIDWGAAWHSIRNASLPLLLAAVLVNIASIVLKGIRWWIFLRAAGSPSLPLAMRATLAGAGLNNVLVANGGD